MGGVRMRGVTEGIEGGVPLVGQRKVVAQLQIRMFKDGNTGMQLPPNEDVIWVMIGRLLQVLFSGAVSNKPELEAAPPAEAPAPEAPVEEPSAQEPPTEREEAARG